MKSRTVDATAPRAFRRRRHARGAALTEWTILVGVVGIVSIGAFISLGVGLVVSFEARRDRLLYPFP